MSLKPQRDTREGDHIITLIVLYSIYIATKQYDIGDSTFMYLNGEMPTRDVIKLVYYQLEGERKFLSDRASQDFIVRRKGKYLAFSPRSYATRTAENNGTVNRFIFDLTESGNQYLSKYMSDLKEKYPETWIEIGQFPENLKNLLLVDNRSSMRPYKLLKTLISQ